MPLKEPLQSQHNTGGSGTEQHKGSALEQILGPKFANPDVPLNEGHREILVELANARRIPSHLIVNPVLEMTQNALGHAVPVEAPDKGPVYRDLPSPFSANTLAGILQGLDATEKLKVMDAVTQEERNNDPREITTLYAAEAYRLAEDIKAAKDKKDQVAAATLAVQGAEELRTLRELAMDGLQANLAAIKLHERGFTHPDLEKDLQSAVTMANLQEVAQQLLDADQALTKLGVLAPRTRTLGELVEEAEVTGIIGDISGVFEHLADQSLAHAKQISGAQSKEAVLADLQQRYPLSFVRQIMGQMLKERAARMTPDELAAADTGVLPAIKPGTHGGQLIKAPWDFSKGPSSLGIRNLLRNRNVPPEK